jgi:hypothetical protein
MDSVWCAISFSAAQSHRLDDGIALERTEEQEQWLIRKQQQLKAGGWKTDREDERLFELEVDEEEGVWQGVIYIWWRLQRGDMVSQKL